MNNILTAYCEPSDSMTSFKLNPTGRWKLVTNRFSRTWLYIEHKRFWRFTTWIHEEDIKFYGIKEAIFDCNTNSVNENFIHFHNKKQENDEFVNSNESSIYWKLEVMFNEYYALLMRLK